MRTDQFARPASLSRRRLLRSVVVGGLATATVALPAAGHAQDAPTDVFQGETYVGGASDPALFVAIVLGNSEARAYLCKTPIHLPGGIDEWLTGSIAADALDLASESGATLSGRFQYGAVSGTATLAGGTTIAYLATRAAGPAGFYSGPRVDRVLRAVSAEGHSLEELVAPVPSKTLAVAGYDPQRRCTWPPASSSVRVAARR